MCVHQLLRKYDNVLQCVMVIPKSRKSQTQYVPANNH